MKTDRIIVTGGYGFIGSHFVNYLLENTDSEIVIVDKLTYAANPLNIKGNVTAIEQDICEITAEQLGDFDYIVHFAAETHVDNSIKNGKPFIHTNVEGTFNLIEIARSNKNLKKFVHVSTDEVYGDMMDRVGTPHARAYEGDRIVPSSYYSSTKAASDMLVMAANRTYELPYIITRACNNYGENQHSEKFLPTVIRNIKEGGEIPVYGNGKQVREWIYVEDHVKAIYTLMKSNKVNAIFNIGTHDQYKNIELITMISEVLGTTPNIKYVEDRLGHDKKYSIDFTKYEYFFGKIQNITLKQWIIKTLQK